MTGQLDLLATVPERPPARRWRLVRPDWLTADAQWAVLERLTQGPACPRDFADMDMFRYGGRVHELRAFGFVISMRKCGRHTHPRNPSMREYVLVALPDSVVAS